MARLAIVVVNYGSTALLAENLVYTAADTPDAMVIVSDNLSSSADASALQSLAAAHDWTVVTNGSNVGFGAAVNAGIRRAIDGGAEEYLVLNPDARVGGASVERLRAAVRKDRRAVAAPVIRTSTGAVWFDGADLYLEDGETRASRQRAAYPGAERVPWISGACMLITREVFEMTNGFAPEYFLYWEDVDFSRRASDAGATLVVVPDAIAVHDAGGTQDATGSRGKSRLYYYYNVRNRLLFAAQHLDDAGIRRWIVATRRVSWRILMRGGRRQLLTDPGVLWATWCGARAGLRTARAALRSR